MALCVALRVRGYLCLREVLSHTLSVVACPPRIAHPLCVAESRMMHYMYSRCMLDHLVVDASCATRYDNEVDSHEFII